MHFISRLFDSNSGQPKRNIRKQTFKIESLEGREVPAVLFYGGNVLPAVETQAVYLGNGWNSQADKKPMDAFLTDITNSSYMDALKTAGYGVGRGTSSAGVTDNTVIANNATIQDNWIQSKLQSDISTGLVKAPDANRLYVVYVQPNVAVNLGRGQGTTTQGVLGYHGAFGGRDATGKAMTIRYAVIAYPGGTVCNSSTGDSTKDQLTSVSSHELAEAVTDPDVNYAKSGWYDPSLGEIGDITENNPKALVNLDGFLVQQVADKNDRLLVINTNSTPPPPTPIPLPPPSQVATKSTISASPVRYRRFGPASTTITMTVESLTGTTLPTGNVQLFYDGQVLASGTLQVVNGQAQVTFSLSFYQSGSFSLSAVYSGNSSFTGSTSNSLTLDV